MYMTSYMIFTTMVQRMLYQSVTRLMCSPERISRKWAIRPAAFNSGKPAWSVAFFALLSAVLLTVCEDALLPPWSS